MQLLGIHHLTAVSADAPGNLAFYTRTLGMRLVKKTVNQDDVSAYHLFYADGEATPGTDITFFDWPAAPERRGTHSIVRTGLRVPDEASLRWWDGRLREAGIIPEEVVDRAGRPTMDFEDREGQRLALVVDDGRGAQGRPWAQSPVPAEHQVRGLGPITLSVPDLAPTDLVLTRLMEMRRAGEYTLPGTNGPKVHVYEMGEGGPASLVFDNVRVPHENILGEEGKGFHLAMQWIGQGRYLLPARALGSVERLVEMAIEQAKNRVTFGQPIAEYQAIQWMIADSAVEIEALRWLVLHAAWLVDQKQDSRQAQSIAKLYGGIKANEIVDRVLQIHGGMGYTRELPIERWYRELRLLRIYEGTDEIQRRTIARNLLKGHANVRGTLG